MLIVYFIGKFATRAAYIVIIIYTCELFPTGLRLIYNKIKYIYYNFFLFKDVQHLVFVIHFD